jgi:hypothetical protein
VIDSYVVVEAEPPSKNEEGADDLSSDNFVKRVKWMMEVLLNELAGSAPHKTWMTKTIEYTAGHGKAKITKPTFGLLFKPMKAQGLMSGGGDGQEKNVPYDITDKGRGVVEGTVVWKQGAGWIATKTGNGETVYTNDKETVSVCPAPLGGAETETGERSEMGIKQSQTVDCYSTDTGIDVGAPVSVDNIAEFSSLLPGTTNGGMKKKTKDD